MEINQRNYQISNHQDRIRKHSKDVKFLLSQSFWAKERPLDIIEKSMEQSLCFAVFDVETDSIVAFARAVTDYATMYYVCDVIVDEKHRGNGLGTMLVDWIVNQEEQLKGKHGMLLTSYAQGLYSKFGFTEFTGSCMHRHS